MRGAPPRLAQPLAADAAVAAVLALLVLPTAVGPVVPVGVAVSDDPGRFGTLTVAVALGQVLPLAWRRRAPLAAAAATCALFGAHLLIPTGESAGDLALIVALYSLAAHVRLTRGSLAAMVALAVALGAVSGYALGRSWGGPADLVPFVLLMVAPPVVVGVALRRERGRRTPAPAAPTPGPARPPSVAPPVMAGRPVTSPVVPLTGREEQVLGLLLRGSSNREIAVALGIGLETVKSHVSRVLGKYAVTSRAELLSLHIRPGDGTRSATRG